METLKNVYFSLVDSWILKSILSIMGAIGASVIHIKHVQVLGAFVLLVVLDLVTKWASIAYQMLISDYRYDPTRVAVWEKYRAIPLAFNHGYIRSEYMRKGFCFKVLTYAVATASAAAADFMFTQSFLVNLVWLYLGSTEFLSILENLRDGGNITMGRFLELVKSKVENKVKL